MADGTTIGLAITTFSSMVLGGGALLRSMRQDKAQADQAKAASDQVRIDAAVVAMQRQINMLLQQVEGYMKSDAQLRADLNTERQERAASETRLRQEHSATETRLLATIATLDEKVERCEADRADLMRQLADAHVATARAPQPGEDQHEPPP